MVCQTGLPDSSKETFQSGIYSWASDVNPALPFFEDFYLRSSEDESHCDSEK